MAVFSNSSILAAVLAKWAQPAIKQLAGERFDSLPWLNAISNKVKSTGWVPQNWSLGKEIAPLLGGMTEVIVAPMIERYLQGLPDNSIPQMAHFCSFQRRFHPRQRFSLFLAILCENR